MREELKLLDLAPRVITLQFLTKTLRNRGIFRSEIIGKVKEDGWSEGEMLTVRIFFVGHLHFISIPPIY